MRARRLNLGLVLVACVLLAAPLFASSPRIVRLSFVQGDVRLDRNAGSGLEKAILNSPVPEGSRIVTGTGGYAEVEFENGGTLRLTESTEVDFPQLSADSNGHLVNLVDVRLGTAYLDAKLEKHSQYRVAVHGGPEVLLHRSSRIRFQVNDRQATVAVFDGEVSIPEKEHQASVKKGDTLTLDFGANTPFTIAKNIEHQPADDWNRERESAHAAQFARAEANTNYGYSGYGEGDLLAYGGYSFIPGYGYMWRPYGFDMGWDPFGYGAWSFYPMWGWTFISPYPWGWAPYRYGSWYNIAGYGWMWQPGYGSVWNAIPVVVNPPGSFRPLRPPRTGPGPTTIVGNPPAAGSGSGVVAGQAVVTPRAPARRPVINRPGTVPHATHTPPKAVQVPGSDARDVGVKPAPATAPTPTPSAAPAPAKPAPVAPPSISAPAPSVPRSAPSAPVHAAPPSMSAPAPSPHMGSFSGGIGHVVTGGHR